MVRHQVTTALVAILALAERRLLEHLDVIGTAADPHCARLPQAEGVEWRARPRAAGGAVAVAHHLRRAVDLECDGAAETGSRMGHVISPIAFGQSCLDGAKLRRPAAQAPVQELNQ